MIDLKKKDPRQARSVKTLDTLLDATAQILAEEGSERLTTNYLAEKAGYSIGTVYQYFPHREAIVLALIERQRARVSHEIEAELARQGDAGAEQKIAGIVAVLHRAFNLHRKPEPRLLQALIRLAATHGLPSPPDTATHAILEVWANADQGTPPLNECEVFVLGAALLETLRQATLCSSPLLGTAEFEQALVRLILGFLRHAAPR